MAKLVINDVHVSVNGEYEFDLSSFKNRELHLIKVETGVRAGELEEAFAAGDSDLLVVTAMIVLERLGKAAPVQTRTLLWEADAGKIEFKFDDPVAESAGDVLPPASAPPESGETETSERTSGSVSETPSGSPPPHLSLTGTQG